MRKLILALVATAAVIVPASAAQATPKYQDPCPGKHVQVYNDAGGNNYPPVGGHGHNNDQGGHFVCGPIKGDTGATGPQGPVGPTGPQGEAGAPGAAGSNGTNGVDGKDGTSGAEGASGLNGKDGVDGKDGASGVHGSDGDTIVGPQGAQGPAGAPADASEIANLRSVVTELNNRLFILEHTVPAETLPPTTTTTQKPVTGELPKTGSNTPFVLAAAFIMLAAGTAFRLLARRG